jgi:putative ABC transport system permease protein
VKALDRKLWRELWSMRVQLLAIVAVVACGIASYVAMLSAHASLSRSRAVYYAGSRFGDVWATVSRAPVALERRIAEIPGVARVETRIVESLTLDVPGLAEPATGRIVSIEGRPGERLNDLHLRRGRWPEPGRAGKVLVSEPFANVHSLVPGDALAAVMGGRRETLQVVGIALSPEYVFAMPAGAPWPDDRRFGVFWMDEEALAAAYGMQGAFDDVTLELGAGASEREVIARLDGLLAPWGGFGAHGRDRQPSHRFLSEELEQLESMGTVVPMIFLGVAAFLLNVVLSRIVGGQRELIAALKALGYGNARLGLHYAEMVLVVVGLGSLLGVGLGAWLGSAMVELYRQFFRFPTLGFSLRTDTILAAVGVSTLAGVVGALASVRRAVALPPAEGMRPPAPPLYRRGISGSAAMARLLSQPARIVARNLGRHPGRAFLSSLGVALSIAIMIAGSFSQDALDYVMDVSFQRQQRHDVQVAFRRPVAPDVLHDLAHLPGVLAVEAERVVPVRLRADTARYETAIVGMPSDPQLKRLVDRDLRPIEIPPSGLMLTDELAHRLGVDIGDRVDVEVLEGERRVRPSERRSTCSSSRCPRSPGSGCAPPRTTSSTRPPRSCRPPPP